MPRQKRKTSGICIFKGIEAKLNKAIFHILALTGPLTTYDIHKHVRHRRTLRHTRYASVNKRVRSLEDLGYIRKIGVKKTKAGFDASKYDLATKAYLALLLDFIDLNDVLYRVDDVTASAILAAIAYVT